MVPNPQESLMCLGALPVPSCLRLKDGLTMDLAPVDPDQEWMGLDPDWMVPGQEWMGLDRKSMDPDQEWKALSHVLIGHVHLGLQDNGPRHRALLVQREQKKCCLKSFLAAPWMIRAGLACEAYWRRRSKKKW